MIKKLRYEQVNRFSEMVEDLKRVQARLDGSMRGMHGNRPFQRQELEPGFSQLLSHVDKAVTWAEEMAWIIDRELS